MYRPGRSGGLPLAADLYCDHNRGPIEGPHPITRGGCPEEPVATKRLGGSAGALLDRGSIVRLLLKHIFEQQLEDTMPGMLFSTGCQWLKCRYRADSKILSADMESRHELTQCRERGAVLPSGAPLDLDRHVAETGDICQTLFVEARRLRLVGDDRRDNRVVSRPNSP